MKFLIVIFLGFATIFEGMRSPSPEPTIDIKQSVVDYFNTWANDFAKSTKDLSLAIKSLDIHNKISLEKAKTALVRCRMQYKRFSFFLDYFFPQQAWIYNAPSKYEVEEPFMEWEEPHGMQYIEEMLFSKDVFEKKLALEAQAKVVQESAGDLKNLLYDNNITDTQLCESLHLELIRIMSLYITGYDAPYLKSGLLESVESLGGLKHIVSIYAPDISEISLTNSFEAAITYLKSHPDFDSFNRLDFLTSFTIPLEKEFIGFAQKHMLADSNTRLQYKMFNLFSTAFISKKGSNNKIIELGKRLFYDSILSEDRSRSCSSCHQPGKYFTDGLKTDLALDGKTPLLRNTPTLLYTANQTTQFWDGRAKSLDELVHEVLVNPKEMNTDPETITIRLNKDINYKKYFNNAFDERATDTISLDQVSTAIAKFVATLSPMNADFDHYMNGNKRALSFAQKRGFNLFMGKAQCGTCHFMPLFNGLTPPSYTKSEYEVIGVPSTDNFKKPVLDSDPGRYRYFAAPFYLAAFKTPSLRNIAKTGPYMHNGSFRSLDKVLEFYNLGGGQGIGVIMPNQTLSEKPLHLSKNEIKDIVLFLNSLTDHPVGALAPETSEESLLKN